MVKKYNIYFLLISSAFFFSMISYENHLYYKYYSLFQLIITGIIVVLFFIFMIYERSQKEIFLNLLNQNICIVLMLTLMLINTVLGHFLYGYSSIKSIPSVVGILVCALTTFFIIPIICTEYPKMERFIINFFLTFSVFLAVFSICIKLNGNSFLGYSLVNVRVASIYYDPNFLGMVLGTAFLIILMKPNKKILKMILLIILGIAVYLTGSRGTMLAIFLSIFIFLIFFLKMKTLKKIMLFLLIGAGSIIILYYLYSSDYFRTYQGSNSRAEMIIFGFESSLKSPIIGYGYQSIGRFLNQNGFHNTSTHNSLMDFLFGYGYITTILYCYLILKIMISSLRNIEVNQYFYIFPTIFMIINSNTILYSFGGVGISSLMFTYILGMLNKKMLENKNMNKNLL